MKTVNKIFSLSNAIYLFALLALIIGAYVNTFFLDGSNLHKEFGGHDEYLTVREVYAILEPMSFTHFVMSVISGSMLYYGRIMYNLDALFAWIPYTIWGVTGMVYAIRMVHVLLTLGALILLAKTFIQDSFRQVLFFLATIFLYYSLYFFMVPKPEPIQLMALAIFLYLFKRKNYKFGWHFIFIGIAYGIKFNVLTILPVMMILPIWHHRSSLKALIVGVCWFALGLFIANPCLLLSPIQPMFLKTYIADTFGSAKHYDDLATVGFGDWLHPLWTTYYTGGAILAMLLVSLVIIIVVKSKTFFTQRSTENNNTLIPIIIGLFLIIPVFLFTKRLWAHYLWTGHVFLLLGIFSMQLDNNNKWKWNIGILLLLLTGIVRSELMLTEGLADREKSKNSEKTAALSAISYIYGKEDSATILIDPSVYYPFTEYLNNKRFHPFASAYPRELPRKSMTWRTPVSVDYINETKATYLILNAENPLKKDAKDITNKHDEMNNKAKQGLLDAMNKRIYRDTSFGSLVVFSVKS